jgi:nucleoside-diphosphate-sugar epimerase
MAYSAVVLGASGNVGRQVVKQLLTTQQFGRVLLLNRKQIEDFPEAIQQDPRLEQSIVNMDMLYEDSLKLLSGFDAAFVTLGAGAPSKVSAEELLRVDCTLPTEFCKAAKETGVRHVSLLTSTGSNYKPDANFKNPSTIAGGSYYLHVKGLVEKNISEMGFESAAFYRPATLIGNTNTPGFFNWLAPKLDWALPHRFQSITIENLGKSIVTGALDALQNPSGVHICEGESLFALIK